jgi:hypothetical protein
MYRRFLEAMPFDAFMRDSIRFLRVTKDISTTTKSIAGVWTHGVDWHPNATTAVNDLVIPVLACLTIDCAMLDARPILDKYLLRTIHSLRLIHYCGHGLDGLEHIIEMAHTRVVHLDRCDLTGMEIHHFYSLQTIQLFELTNCYRYHECNSQDYRLCVLINARLIYKQGQLEYLESHGYSFLLDLITIAKKIMLIQCNCEADVLTRVEDLRMIESTLTIARPLPTLTHLEMFRSDITGPVIRPLPNLQNLWVSHEVLDISYHSNLEELVLLGASGCKIHHNPKLTKIQICQNMFDRMDYRTHDNPMLRDIYMAEKDIPLAASFSQEQVSLHKIEEAKSKFSIYSWGYADEVHSMMYV